MHIPSVSLSYTFLHPVTLGTNATPNIGSSPTAIGKYNIANITIGGYRDICIEDYWPNQAIVRQQYDSSLNQFSRAECLLCRLMQSKRVTRPNLARQLPIIGRDGECISTQCLI